MITLTPVLEGWFDTCPFWPVERTGSFFAVPRVPTPQRIGAVVWALIANADDLSVAATGPAAAIERYLAAGDDQYAPGGLRISSDGVVIDPGCCNGLEEWRDWLRVLDGQAIDLGHDPTPLMEPRGPVIRVGKDRGLRLSAAELSLGEPHIDIPRDALPGLLDAVQRDLVDFLAALHPWAQAISHDLADPLVEAVDRRLQITAPIGLQR